MKKNIFLLVIGCMMMLLFGCGKVENPMKNASPSTSMLSFYKYDGNKTTRLMMSDTTVEREILARIDQLDFKKVRDWTPENATCPIYGLSICGQDGYMIEVLWNDNIWIMNDGEVLTAEFDMSKLETDYEWGWKDEFDSITVFPCASHLLKSDKGWNVEFMTPAAELGLVEDITMTIIEQTPNSIKVRIENNSQSSWEYGEFYSIQVLLDGTWYEVPTLPGDWAFNTIAYILPQGESVDKGYGFDMYGTLPAGTYRLVVEELTAEFEIK